MSAKATAKAIAPVESVEQSVEEEED